MQNQSDLGRTVDRLAQIVQLSILPKNPHFDLWSALKTVADTTVNSRLRKFFLPTYDSLQDWLAHFLAGLRAICLIWKARKLRFRFTLISCSHQVTRLNWLGWALRRVTIKLFNCRFAPLFSFPSFSFFDRTFFWHFHHIDGDRSLTKNQWNTESIFKYGAEKCSAVSRSINTFPIFSERKLAVFSNRDALSNFPEEKNYSALAKLIHNCE